MISGEKIPTVEKNNESSVDLPDWTKDPGDVASVIKEFKPSDGKVLEYVGSATSDFQAEPLMVDSQGQPQIFSEWELLVVNAQQNKGHIIHTPEQIKDLPNFHTKMDSYFDRSKALGENMFRFSLDFARLCPNPEDPNDFNEKLMSTYVKALALVKARGMEPMLTIYHWPMPLYLVTRDEKGKIKDGGWEHPEAAQHFRGYVENIVKFLGDDKKVRNALEDFSKQDQDKFLADGLVKYFISINEPTTLTLNGYMAGIFPPFKKFNIPKFKQVINELVKAHDITYESLKEFGIKKFSQADQQPQVGLAHNWTHFDGLLGNFAQKQLNERITKKFERDGTMSDFLALQYYCSALANPLYKPMGPIKAEKGREYGDHPGFGNIYPPGIYEHLKSMNQLYPQKEIFITEFGFVDNQDIRRPYWLLETVRYALEAKKAGVPLKGMLLWSLVNNFEWEKGVELKLGLFSEQELDQELVPSPRTVSGHEAWQAVLNTIADPSEKNISSLEEVQERAKNQYIDYFKKGT